VLGVGASEEVVMVRLEPACTGRGAFRQRSRDLLQSLTSVSARPCSFRARSGLDEIEAQVETRVLVDVPYACRRTP